MGVLKELGEQEGRRGKEWSKTNCGDIEDKHDECVDGR